MIYCNITGGVALGVVLPPGAGVAVVAPPVGGVGYTIAPFIVSTMVLISGNFTP